MTSRPEQQVTGATLRSRRLATVGRARRQLVSAVLRAATVGVAVVVITFSLVRLIPGNPVVFLAGAHATPAARNALRQQLDLNRSVLDQFGSYIGNLARGDLGTSVTQQGRSVASIIGGSLPITLELVGLCMLISALVGVTLGLVAALRGGATDAVIRSGMSVLLAVPPFFLGLLLVLWVALGLGWLPAGGWG